MRAFPFDAVLFDLDGTLVATDRFWVQAARTGARRAFAELGIERELPDAEGWMSLVGKPLDVGFRELFPELPEDQLRTLMSRCEEEEHALINAGGAALMPGAGPLLQELASRGVRLGIASNCSAAYLEAMGTQLGLDRIVPDALCLDSPGIRTKADMLAELLCRFGTRSAVMVGDRATDRDAAWANGLPHVHCAFGFATRFEGVEAEGRLEDLGGLLELCEGRGTWIQRALERGGVFRDNGNGPATLGITGPVAAGKTLFARDAARVLAEEGRRASVVSLDAFRHAPDTALESTSPETDPFGARFHWDALERELVEPHARGEEVRLTRTGYGPGDLPEEHTIHVRSGELLVLEGPFLLDPRLRSRLSRVIHLEAPDELLLRRIAGREGRSLGPGAIERARSTQLLVERDFDRHYEPTRLADLVLDASNALGSPQGAPTSPLGG